MCESLSELREALKAYAGDFDADLLQGLDAAPVMQEAAAIEHMAADLKARAALRVAETGAWKDSGDRSAAHHLARATGTSVGAAVDAIVAARRLESLPATAVAVRTGELSAQQASVVADAASADPAAESQLLAKAKKCSLAELREEAARVKASADPDPEERRRRIHDRRHLRSFTDGEGAWHMNVVNNPEVGAQVMAVISAIKDRLFRAARTEGRREPVEAYAADALTELARMAAGAEGPEDDSDGEVGKGRPRRRSGINAKLIARVDLEALLRGYPVSGEVCDIVGYGPVAVSALYDLIETQNPFLAAVVTKGEPVMGVAHLGRRANAKQQTALEWLFPECTVLGCSAQSRLQTDHRHDWADTHMTVLDWLDGLCGHHHLLKTRDRWALVEGRGKRAMVPPDDPRHPRYEPPPGDERAPPEEGGETQAA